MKYLIHAASVLLLSSVTVALPSEAAAAPTTEIPSAFLIAKSGNKNQVHYAVHVNDTCAPSVSVPVRAFWRMLDRGPEATEPLDDSELRAFGIEHQDVGADRVAVTLRGLPSRVITIRTWRTPEGTCTSSASTTVAGVPARLASIYVKQKLFGVDYVLFTGWAADGAVVRERLSP